MKESKRERERERERERGREGRRGREGGKMDVERREGRREVGR